MSGEVWEEIYDRLAELIRAHRTTLVFVNTRRLAERVARHLAERLGRGRGHRAPRQPLQGDPARRRGAAQGRQAPGAGGHRVARAGHRHRARGSGLPARHAAADRHLPAAGGPLRPHGARHAQGPALPAHPRRAGRVHRAARARCAGASSTGSSCREQPLDVLAQQIVAEAAAEDWEEDELFAAGPPGLSVPRPRRGPSSTRWSQMLAQGFATRRGRRGALIHHDAVNGRLRGRRGARLLAITSGGAIPDNADYRVVLEPEGTFIGTVNEDFAVESIAGDIFQLGNISWRILRVEQGTVRVEDARGQPPSIPVLAGRGAGAERRAVGGGGGAAAASVEIAARSDHGDVGVAAELGRCETATRRRRRRAAQLVEYLGRGPAAARRAADPGHHRRRALLRRGGRHAARHPRAVRQPGQPGLGPGAAQAFLPPVQLRAAGGGHRGRAPALARARSIRSRWRRLPLPPSRHGARRSWSRRCSTRRCSAPAGAGTRTSRSPSRGAAAAARSRPRSSAWRRTTCWPRRSPTPRPAWRTSPATGRSPIIRWCGRRSTTACTRRWTSTASSTCCAGSSAARSSCIAPRPARAVAARPRDPQRQALRLPGRRAAGGAPHPGGLHPPRLRALLRRRPRRARSRRPSSGCGTRPGPRSENADELHDALLTSGFLTEAEGSAGRDGQSWSGYLRRAGRGEPGARGPGGRPGGALGRDGASRSRGCEQLGGPELAARRHARAAPRPARHPRPGDRGRSSPRRSACRRPSRGRAGRARGGGRGAAGPVHAGPCAPGARVVRPPAAGPDPSLHAQPAPGRDRAGERRRTSCGSCSPGSGSIRSIGPRGSRGWPRSSRSSTDSRLPAAAWESDVLAARCEEYDPTLLDTLCLTGRVAWGRLRGGHARTGGGGGPIRTTPIALFLAGARRALAREPDRRPTTQRSRATLRRCARCWSSAAPRSSTSWWQRRACCPPRWSRRWASWPGWAWSRPTASPACAR